MFQRADKVVFFDGLCNFCNSSVNFIIKKDKSQSIYFSALQSGFAQNILSENSENSQETDYLIYIRGKNLHRKSDAALYILKDLKIFWSFLYYTKVVPRRIRDFFYVLFAKNRYKLFGKKDSCMIPTPETRSRFLE